MLTEQLNRHFGFDSFLKGQEDVIQRIIDGQSAAAIFPTGAGKSLCYQLPAMMLPGITLVVSPLLSLMKDQLDFLTAKGIPAARLDSTLSRDDYNATLEGAKNNKLKILMISVERFKNERFRFHLDKMNVSLLAIDEAHCISEWGHNFRPEYLMLPHYREAFRIPQVLLLTATATMRTIDDMCAKFAIPRGNVTVTGSYRKNLFLQVTPTSESEKTDRLLNRLSDAPDVPTIVYVTLQKTAENVADFLKQNGIGAHPYHAGMDNDMREEIQNRFMAGDVSCIVATIAFGMGIDKRNIRRIIHFDLPKSVENYSQEIGRSGRDGRPALCEILANRDNIHVLENFIYGDTPEKHSIRQLLQDIRDTEQPTWEVKLVQLSSKLNIRMLPLKTLLVYLGVENIIRPRLVYFEQYSFKYLQEPESIIGRFEGERQRFVRALFENCVSKKVWTHVDLDATQKVYGANRERILAALDYLDERGWIQLQAKQSVEVYDIMDRSFDADMTANKMHRLFEEKESLEIKRIHDMVDFFETDGCNSKTLAGHFGDDIGVDRCGHCSHCTEGKAVLEHTVPLSPISESDYQATTDGFAQAIGSRFTEENLARFLCGIYTPVFSRLKVKDLPHFGIFGRYPYAEVRDWIREQDTGSSSATHDG